MYRNFLWAWCRWGISSRRAADFQESCQYTAWLLPSYHHRQEDMQAEQSRQANRVPVPSPLCRRRSTCCLARRATPCQDFR